jgi:hypothetical protein
MADDLTPYAGHHREVIVSFSGKLFAPCILRRVRNSKRFGHSPWGGVDEVHGFVIFRFTARDDQVTQADDSSFYTSNSRPPILTCEAEVLKYARGELCNKLGRWYQEIPGKRRDLWISEIWVAKGSSYRSLGSGAWG